MANSYPPWASYRALMACCLVALDNCPGVFPVGIGETLRQSIAKLVIRAVGGQANTVCESLQLFADLEAGIEGATHAMAQMRQERRVAALGERSDKGSEGAENGGVEEPSETARSGEAARVGGIEEVPQITRERSSE